MWTQGDLCYQRWLSQPWLLDAAATSARLQAGLQTSIATSASLQMGLQISIATAVPEDTCALLPDSCVWTRSQFVCSKCIQILLYFLEIYFLFLKELPWVYDQCSSFDKCGPNLALRHAANWCPCRSPKYLPSCNLLWNIAAIKHNSKSASSLFHR